ncbi:MAG: pyridoxamine 5'-phosphate oxidase [Bacteroidetes bacterium]|nr:pyridoxamine 5'-phosphate oxidase [Bacteroidota bacterium]
MNKVNRIIKSLRNDFEFLTLNQEKVSKNPITQFEQWMENALEVKVQEPNAMTLATVGKNGQPDARIVLLRGVDKNGFSFFTNYKSLKGREIRENKKVCLNFYWPEVARQVRITGIIEKISSRASDEYFQSRPRESQIGAWASEQSAAIENRGVLEKKFVEYEKKFTGKKISRPPHWGGYAVKPAAIEFWQGRASRLHDRILYEKKRNGLWKISRLSP